MNYRTLYSAIFLSLSIGTASAIELFETIRLSTSPYESRAAAGWSSGTSHSCPGVTTDAQGHRFPNVWQRDSASGIIEETLLPIPPGLQGECTGGCEFANGDVAVTGNVWTGSNRWGVVWRKPLFGGWSNPIVLCEDAEQSYVASFCCSGTLGSLLQSGSALENGRWVPTVHAITSDAVVTTELPVPPGADGAALSVGCGPAGELAACGWIQMPNGLRKPCMWPLDGGIWSFDPIPVPSNASGQANDVLRIDSGWVACGGTTRSNRTRGFLFRNMDGAAGGNFVVLDPWGQYGFSSALRLADHPLQDDVAFVTGQAWNSGEPPTATVQTVDVAEDYVLGFPYAFAELDYSGGDTGTHEVRSAEFGDGFAFGQCIDEEDFPFPSACLFLPTTTQVPDELSLFAGQYGGGELQGLWHANDAGLALQSERVNGVQTVVLELGYSPVCGVDGATYSNQIISRVRRTQGTSSPKMEVLVQDPADGSWDVAGVCEDMFDDIYGVYDVNLPGAASQWMEPGSRTVRMRLRVTSTQAGPFGFEIDHVSLTLN